MKKLFEELSIKGMVMYYECLCLFDDKFHNYYVSPEHLLMAILNPEQEFETVKKRTRTWIEPKTK